MKRLMTLAATGMLVCAVSCTALAAGQAAVFGTVAFRAQSHEDLPKWGQVLAAIERERPVYEACATGGDCPSRRVAAWQAKLKSLAYTDRSAQLRKVNDYVNRWGYRDDASNWGRSDYWASPLEFMQHSGDCEDYVIMKYVSLRALGVPADAMRMVIVRDTLRDIAHAVLAVEHEGDIVILDNLTDAVLSHRRIKHYAPYYSVNEETRWAHASANEVVVAASGRFAR